MGFSGQILIPSECWDMPRDVEGVEIAPFAEAIRRADLFIFEFGYGSQKLGDPVRTGRQPTTDDARALSVVKQLFKQTAAIEDRTRPPGRRVARRFVGVNVINNAIWETFSATVNAPLTPFCSQVAAGVARVKRPGGQLQRLRSKFSLSAKK